MHRAIKSRPHHLRDTAGVIAVGLVDLRLQNSPHVPCLDTDDRQVCFTQRGVKPLRQWSGFQSKAFERIAAIPQDRQQSVRFTRNLGLANDPVSSTMQTLVSLADTSNPPKCFMLRFSF